MTDSYPAVISPEPIQWFNEKIGEWVECCLEYKVHLHPTKWIFDPNMNRPHGVLVMPEVRKE